MAEETARDREYRQRSTRHMFMGALYGALGMASFFGLIQNVVGMFIKSFSTEVAAQAATTTAKAATGFLGVTPVGWAVIGGLMAVGAVFTYMAQTELTKLKEVQDDRLAYKNAEELKRCHGLSPNAEYPQNCRTDNGKWVDNIHSGSKVVELRR